MENTKKILLITMACVIFGFISVLAFDREGKNIEIGEVTSVKKVQDLNRERIKLEAEKKEHEDRIKELQEAILQFEQDAARRDSQAGLINEQLLNTRAYAGYVALEGPGVEIVLNDRKRDSIIINNFNYFIVHDSDVLNVLNELKAAGAEAIAINGTRIMANSRISCGGPTINVGRYGRFTPPFIIHAIGDPDILAASFQQPDSVYNDLVAWGLEFKIKKLDYIEIPRYLGEIELKFASTVRE